MILTKIQLQQLQQIYTSDLNGSNFSASYTFLRDAVLEQARKDYISGTFVLRNENFTTALWFEVAQSTNGQSGDIIDTELRGITEAICRSSGKPFSDDLYNTGSNQLAKNLIGKIISTGGEIPTIESIVTADGENFGRAFDVPSWKWPGTMGDWFVLGGDWVEVPGGITDGFWTRAKELLFLSLYGASYGFSYISGLQSSNLQYFNLAQLTEMANLATTQGLSARAALKLLLPLAISDAGKDFYSVLNKNGDLDIYSPLTGTGQMTDLYIKDRAAMISWLVYASNHNLSDTTGGVLSIPRAASNSGGYWVFQDVDAKKTVIDNPLGARDGHQVIFGGAGADALTGGAFTDHLFGGTGDDTINGQGGDDYLEGGSGSDSLLGGSGNDTLLGMEGNDVLKGEAGKDSLMGGAGSDLLDGGDDNDTLSGGDNTDSLYGGKGNDSLFGGVGDDVLDGGADNDWLE